VTDAFTARKTSDVARLKQLRAKLPSALEILAISGEPPSSIKCRIRIPTARDDKFPATRQDATDVEIQLPDRYPQNQPSVYITTPIWNPNVFTGGKWCYGNWSISEFLDLFVFRLMRVVALDPIIINTKSPANATANEWFIQLKKRQPHLFPTVDLASLEAPSASANIGWRNIR
jgi:hypothetical protein